MVQHTRCSFPHNEYCFSSHLADCHYVHCPCAVACIMRLTLAATSVPPVARLVSVFAVVFANQLSYHRPIADLISRPQAKQPEGGVNPPSAELTINSRSSQRHYSPASLTPSPSPSLSIGFLAFFVSRLRLRSLSHPFSKSGMGGPIRLHHHSLGVIPNWQVICFSHCHTFQNHAPSEPDFSRRSQLASSSSAHRCRNLVVDISRHSQNCCRLCPPPRLALSGR